MRGPPAVLFLRQQVLQLAQPHRLSIYDSYAEECLWQYKKQGGFLEYDRNHYDYAGYVGIVGAFREHYGLRQFTFKELDKFLYLTGGHLKGKFVFAALAEGRLGTEAIVSIEPRNPHEEVPQVSPVNI